MTQIVLLSSPSALRMVAAVIDEGRLGAGKSQRRILVTYSGSYAPEAADPLSDGPGTGPLLKRFDQVVSWDQLVYPYHPCEWTPHHKDVIVFERLLRERWNLGAEEPELVVESVDQNPALTLASIFANSPISAVSAGLSTYGPMRREPPRGTAARIERLHFVDLINGLGPSLLSPYDVPPQPVETDALCVVTSEVSAECASLVDRSGVPGHAHVAVVLGHSHTWSDGLTEATDERLLVEMAVTTGRATNSPVVLKQPPDAPRRPATRVVERARREGVQVEIVDDPLPAEALCDVLAPELVTSCVARGLFATSTLHRHPIAGFGTARALAELSPYGHGNRIPAATVHAFAPVLTTDGIAPPRIDPDRVATDGQMLIETISYCMQPELLSKTRPVISDYISSTKHNADVIDCIGRGRLRRLGLLQPDNPLSRQVSRATVNVDRAVRRIARRLARRLRSRPIRRG